MVSYSNPISFPSLPLLFAGPEVIVKFSKGSFVPAFTCAWLTIRGSWLVIFPPPSLLLYAASQGLFTPHAYVILLLKTLSVLKVAALRRTKMLFVNSMFFEADPKQGAVEAPPGPYHKL